MAGKRPGVLMRFNEWRALGALSPERFKRVFLAALNLAEFGAEPEGLDEVENVALSLVRPAIEEDGQKYKQKVEAAIKAANERWGHAGEDEYMPTDTTACDPMQDVPSTSPLSFSNSYSHPSLEEIAAEVRRAGLSVDAAQFLADCEADGWKDGHGAPVRDWQKWLRGYAALNRASRPPRGGQTPTALRFDQRQYTEDELRGITARNMQDIMDEARTQGGGEGV